MVLGGANAAMNQRTRGKRGGRIRDSQELVVALQYCVRVCVREGERKRGVFEILLGW